MKSTLRKTLSLLMAAVILIGFLFMTPVRTEVEAANLASYIYQLPPRLTNASGKYRQNMSYIIKTRNGKIIVIDGGYADEHADSAYLLSQLKSITGKSVPNVDAWLFSHLHEDHTGAFADLVTNYSGQFTVSKVYYRFPTDAEIDKYCPESSRTTHKNLVAAFKNHVKLAKQANGTPTETVTVTSRFDNRCLGTFDIDTVHFDVLMTCEDVFWGADNITTKYSGNLSNNGKAYSSQTIKQLVEADFGNNTTTIFRMTVGGKTTIFLGDAAEPEGLVMRYFHDKNAANPGSYFSLKSDIVQMAHHGQNGVPKSVYTAIDPDIALWPAPDWLYNASSSSTLTTYYTRQWMSALGVTNYVAKDGLKTVSFPDLRTEAQPAISAEMKPIVFDATYYANRYPDVKNAFGSDEAKLYAHFLKYGIEEGRCASPYFDVKYYTTQNSLKMLEYCRGNYERALDHFLKYAYLEDEYASAGKKLSPTFDCKYYKNKYPELANLGIKTEFDLLKYYISTGKSLGHVTAAEVSSDGTVYHPVANMTAVAPTCTVEGKTAGKICSSCNKVFVAQQAIPPTGHSYTYTKLNALTHTVGCKNCSYSAQAAHSYTDGSCICGEAEIKEPILDSSLVINHTLNLAGDISVNFAVNRSVLEDFDADSLYLQVSLPEYEGNVQVGTTTCTLKPVLNGDYYYFTLDGMTAVQMNNELQAVLHGTKDGQPYYSPTDVYSIAKYAYSQLNKEGALPTLKTLCADLLRYGSAAQSFKVYRTDAPADAAMTTTHRSWLSNAEAVTFGNNNRILDDLSEPSVTWVGKSLNLESKVTLKFVFSTANYRGSLSDLNLRVSFTDIHGAAKTTVVSQAEAYGTAAQQYAFSFDGLLAAELRSVVSAQIYEGNTPVSPTLQYSADTYGNNKVGALGTLCRALFAYSDSAKAYFN